VGVKRVDKSKQKDITHNAIMQKINFIMKTKKKNFAIILLMVVIGFFTVSCQKQKETNMNATDKNSQKTLETMDIEQKSIQIKNQEYESWIESDAVTYEVMKESVAEFKGGAREEKIILSVKIDRKKFRENTKCQEYLSGKGIFVKTEPATAAVGMIGYDMIVEPSEEPFEFNINLGVVSKVPEKLRLKMSFEPNMEEIKALSKDHAGIDTTKVEENYGLLSTIYTSPVFETPGLLKKQSVDFVLQRVSYPGNGVVFVMVGIDVQPWKELGTSKCLCTIRNGEKIYGQTVIDILGAEEVVPIVLDWVTDIHDEHFFVELSDFKVFEIPHKDAEISNNVKEVSSYKEQEGDGDYKLKSFEIIPKNEMYKIVVDIEYDGKPEYMSEFTHLDAYLYNPNTKSVLWMYSEPTTRNPEPNIIRMSEVETACIGEIHNRSGA